MTGGQLVITSTRGMAYQTPTQNAANNTQVNMKTAMDFAQKPRGLSLIWSRIIHHRGSSYFINLSAAARSSSDRGLPISFLTMMSVGRTGFP